MTWWQWLIFAFSILTLITVVLMTTGVFKRFCMVGYEYSEQDKQCIPSCPKGQQYYVDVKACRQCPLDREWDEKQQQCVAITAYDCVGHGQCEQLEGGKYPSLTACQNDCTCGETCATNEVCCKNESGTGAIYGCCKLEDSGAVCCGQCNGCCPHGYSCDCANKQCLADQDPSFKVSMFSLV